MIKSLPPIPKFANEAEERAYWESQDSSVHVDWEKAESATLPNLKPTAKSPSFDNDVRKRKNS